MDTSIGEIARTIEQLIALWKSVAGLGKGSFIKQVDELIMSVEGFKDALDNNDREMLIQNFVAYKAQVNMFSKRAISVLDRQMDKDLMTRLFGLGMRDFEYLDEWLIRQIESGRDHKERSLETVHPAFNEVGVEALRDELIATIGALRGISASINALLPDSASKRDQSQKV